MCKAKETKLIEGGHRGLQDYRHIHAASTFFTFFTFFSKSVVTFYVFCHVSYVFSNYALQQLVPPYKEAMIISYTMIKPARRKAITDCIETSVYWAKSALSDYIQELKLTHVNAAYRR